MLIYIDKEYKCHTDNEKNFPSIETNFFDGKCSAFIEGYRYIPTNETWTREDGVQFTGEMIAPWKPYHELREAQLIYEKEQAEEAFQILLEGAETE